MLLGGAARLEPPGAAGRARLVVTHRGRWLSEFIEVENVYLPNPQVGARAAAMVRKLTS